MISSDLQRQHSTPRSTPPSVYTKKAGSPSQPPWKRFPQVNRSTNEWLSVIYAYAHEEVNKLAIWGVATLKAKKLTTVAVEVGSATSHLFEYILPQIQATIETAASYTSSASTFLFGSAAPSTGKGYAISQLLWPITETFSQAKSALTAFSNHPYMAGLRMFFLVKQTNDLVLTALGFSLGEKSTENLFNQSINTLIAWTPILLRSFQAAGNLEGLFYMNVLSSLCLVYSMRQDYRNYYDPATREKSPTYQILKEGFYAVKTGLSNLFWA